MPRRGIDDGNACHRRNLSHKFASAWKTEVSTGVAAEQCASLATEISLSGGASAPHVFKVTPLGHHLSSNHPNHGVMGYHGGVHVSATADYGHWSSLGTTRCIRSHLNKLGLAGQRCRRSLRLDTFAVLDPLASISACQAIAGSSICAVTDMDFAQG